MKQLRIVIADDSERIRSEIREAVSRVPGLTTSAEAADGMEAFRLYNQINPDVLILDLSMPKASGLEILQRVRKNDKSTVIILFTADSTLALRDACLREGANFYLDKSQLDSLIGILQHLQTEDQV